MSADQLVALLGWEPLAFFDKIKDASLPVLEETLRILAPRCPSGSPNAEYNDMLGDGAILGLIDEALRREGGER